MPAKSKAQAFKDMEDEFDMEEESIHPFKKLLNRIQ